MRTSVRWALFVSSIVAISIGAGAQSARAQSYESKYGVPPENDSNGTASNSTDTPQHAPPASDSKPPCEKRDDLECGEQCREYFDVEYKECVADCLKGRCVRQATVSKDQLEDAQNAGEICIETESRVCDDQCKSELVSERPRCRRACLQQRCPDARRYDAAREGADPGSAKCSRCRDDAQYDCRRQCQAGTFGQSASREALERFGCEKLCVATACVSSCGARLPF